MATYGLWKERIEIGGQLYHADLVDQHYSQRAGFSKIYALNGLPPQFAEDLIRASQICDVPHTWRVKECQSENEVTEDILKQGKEVLDRDMKELHAHVITYLGNRESQSNTYEFLAAGAIRDKLTRDYQNEQYPVVSRAVVAPTHRGKSLGSLIVEHRMKAVLHYFCKKPKAIHFATDSKKILHSVKKVEQEEGLEFVYIGDERYQAADGTHTVHDFLCFLPWFREKLLEACGCLQDYTNSRPILEEFKDKLDLFTKKGLEGISGAHLEALFEKAVNSLDTQSEIQEDARNARQLIEEVFLVKRKIGAGDPQ